MAGQAAQAQYACHVPATPESWDVKGSPHGQWTMFHNTNNWSYKAVPGRDYYQKNSNHNKRVEIDCSSSPFDSVLGIGSQLVNDLSGNYDKCAVKIPAAPARDYAPTCPNNGAYNYSRGACYKNGQLAYGSLGSPKPVIPFGIPTTPSGQEYCPDGGSFTFTPASPIAIMYAQPVNIPTASHLTCPAGEFKGREIFGEINNALEQPRVSDYTANYGFKIPENSSRAYLSLGIRPNNNPYLSNHAAIRISNRVADQNPSATMPNSSPVHVYYEKSLGLGAAQLKYLNVAPSAIIMRRWEPESIPNYVHIGFPIYNIIPGPYFADKAYINLRTINKTGGVANLHSDVDYVKLEWCAPMQEITAEVNMDIGLPSSPVGSGNNGAPYFAPRPAMIVNHGQNVNVDVTPVDPDGDTMTVTATGLPPGMSLMPSWHITGAYSGSNCGGNYTIMITATDSNGVSASTSVNMSIPSQGPGCGGPPGGPGSSVGSTGGRVIGGSTPISRPSAPIVAPKPIRINQKSPNQAQSATKKPVGKTPLPHNKEMILHGMDDDCDGTQDDMSTCKAPKNRTKTEKKMVRKLMPMKKK